MVKVSELPIYDAADALPKPKPSPCTNVESVVTSNINNYILNPSRRFISARQSEFSDLLDHVTSPIGAAQVVTIAGSVIFGRKLSQRILPMSAKRQYTVPFKMAHYTIAGVLPLTAICMWYETPREWTMLILKNSALYTGKALYFVTEWSLYIAWQTVSFICGSVWWVIKSVIWTLPVSVITGSFNVTKSVFSMLTESPEPAAEIETIVEKETVEELPEPVNPSVVEVELSEKTRHGDDEVLIKIGSNPENEVKIEIEEDLGQSEEGDKDMFPSRNR